MQLKGVTKKRGMHWCSAYAKIKASATGENSKMQKVQKKKRGDKGQKSSSSSQQTDYREDIAELMAMEHGGQLVSDSDSMLSDYSGLD